jgi:hypothetical protein
MAEEIDFYVETEGNSTSRTLRYCPINGMLNSAIIQFPATNAVEIRLNKGTIQLLPAVIRGGVGDRGLSLNDTTRVFSLHKPIKIGESLEVVVENNNDELQVVTVIINVDESQRYTGG